MAFCASLFYGVLATFSLGADSFVAVVFVVLGAPVILQPGHLSTIPARRMLLTMCWSSLPARSRCSCGSPSASASVSWVGRLLNTTHFRLLVVRSFRDYAGAASMAALWCHRSPPVLDGRHDGHKCKCLYSCRVAAILFNACCPFSLVLLDREELCWQHDGYAYARVSSSHLLGDGHV